MTARPLCSSALHVGGVSTTGGGDQKTFSVAYPLRPPPLAVIVAVPVPTPVARPCEPALLLTVATAVLDEDHETMVVTFCIEPSENVAMAENCLEAPLLTDSKLGETLMDTSVGALTVRVALSVLPAIEAVIVVVPIPPPTARPCVPGLLLMVATDVTEDDQVTRVVRLCVMPSE